MWGYGHYSSKKWTEQEIDAAIEKHRQNVEKKEKRTIDPICLESKKLALTWWGKSWNENLERYADYDSRLSRGRAYVRGRKVIDLHIEAGKISAYVLGSRTKPYQITILIDKMNPEKWQALAKQCDRRVGSLGDLLAGKFPEQLATLFFDKGNGLFPAPQEIHFACSCLDWADMCKHIAATLYAIGAKLDRDPSLFFTLRGIEFEQLLKKSAEERVSALLKNADIVTERTLDTGLIGSVFGIEVE